MPATSDAPTSSTLSPAGEDPAAVASTIELADELRLTVGRLARRIRQQSTLGLTPSQYSALVSIDQLQPVRLGDLAAAEGVSAPTVTKVVNLLEVAGLVEREVDASDRRSSFVRLTEAGKETLSRIRTERTAFLRQRLDELSPAQRELLVKALPALAALADARRSMTRHLRSTFASLLSSRQLPPLLRRPDRLPGRHLDAAHRPGLAGAAAERQRHRSRARDRGPVPARAAPRPLGRRRRRPLRQPPDS